MERFAGRCALVTGAGGGIGTAIVRQLREEGARVAAADEALDGVQAEVLLPGDLTDTAYVEGLAAAAREALGGLDMLFNNAGVISRGAVTEASDADFALGMAVNVEAPFRLCRAAIPLMAAAGGGCIVNVASCWGLQPGPAHAVYCASKAALAALTRCMARDHAGEGVRINAVCPNEVNTPMLRSGFAARGLDAEAGLSQLGASVPLGRVAEPEEIADAALFLASEQARYVCGALLEVNGGKAVG